jgi:hypothetical protein
LRLRFPNEDNSIVGEATADNAVDDNGEARPESIASLFGEESPIIA